MLKRTWLLVASIGVISLLVTTIYAEPLVKGLVFPWVTKNTKAEITTNTLSASKLFVSEQPLTNRQMLWIFSSLLGELPKEVIDSDAVESYCKKAAEKYDVMLPSDLVFSTEDWTTVWDNLLLGKIDFVKVAEDKYSATLIPGYFSIYLNKNGLEMVERGILPQNIVIYSPFAQMYNLTDVTLDSPATKGFALELLSIYDMYVHTDKQDLSNYLQKRPALMGNLTTMVTENSVGKVKAEWGSEEIAKYNYIGLSYSGAMQYGILRGYVNSNVTVSDMNTTITGVEASLLVHNVLNTNGAAILDILNTVDLEMNSVS